MSERIKYISPSLETKQQDMWTSSRSEQTRKRKPTAGHPVQKDDEDDSVEGDEEEPREVDELVEDEEPPATVITRCKSSSSISEQPKQKKVATAAKSAAKSAAKAAVRKKPASKTIDPTGLSPKHARLKRLQSRVRRVQDTTIPAQPKPVRAAYDFFEEAQFLIHKAFETYSGVLVTFPFDLRGQGSSAWAVSVAGFLIIKNI